MIGDRFGGEVDRMVRAIKMIGEKVRRWATHAARARNGARAYQKVENVEKWIGWWAVAEMNGRQADILWSWMRIFTTVLVYSFLVPTSNAEIYFLINIWMIIFSILFLCNHTLR